MGWNLEMPSERLDETHFTHFHQISQQPHFQSKLSQTLYSIPEVPHGKNYAPKLFCEPTLNNISTIYQLELHKTLQLTQYKCFKDSAQPACCNTFYLY